MLKRMIILIMLGTLLGSCQEIKDFGTLIGVKDMVDGFERDRERKEARKKDAYAAAGNPKYEAGVEEAIQDIMKRPVNKRVEFGGTTLILPENTRINQKHGNIVDEKTGYGIPIIFEITKDCTTVFYQKKIMEGLYYELMYNENDSELDTIAKKIIKANGFTKTCKYLRNFLRLLIKGLK